MRRTQWTGDRRRCAPLHQPTVALLTPLNPPRFELSVCGSAHSAASTVEPWLVPLFLVIKTRSQILSLISAATRRSPYCPLTNLRPSALWSLHCAPKTTKLSASPSQDIGVASAGYLPYSARERKCILRFGAWPLARSALPPLAEGRHETDPRHRQQSFRPAVSGYRRAQCTWVSAACLPLELTACPPEPSHASLPAPSASSVSSARPPPHAPTAHSASLSTCRQATMDINEHANCVEDPGRCVWAA